MNAPANQGAFAVQHPAIQQAQIPYNGQEDFDILRLRQGGLSWPAIAARLPGRTFQSIAQRHARLTQDPELKRQTIAANTPVLVVSRTEGEIGCAELLARQIATGQYNGAARSVWLARHGDAA